MGNNKIISNDQALDILPYIVIICEKTDLEEQIANISKKHKGAKSDEEYVLAALDVVKHIIKNIKNVKQEVFEIVAIVEGIEIDDVKNQSFITTIKSFKAIFSNPDLVDFFKEAVQGDTQKR